jgi:hypothetical protein
MLTKFKIELQLIKRKIELFFLPPYCLELNPDELFNHDVKSILLVESEQKP